MKVVISFFLGLIPLVLVPTLMGECEYGHCRISDRRVTSTTTAVVKPGYQLAFEDLILSQGLVKKAQSTKGNVNFAVIQNLETKNRYEILETWADIAKYNDWIT